MTRFDRLEFNSPHSESAPPPAAETPGTRPVGNVRDELHDEQYWLKQAQHERREGHFENALRYYSRALEVEKSLLPAWLGQVQMLVQLGENKEAELWARKALELFRKNGDLTAARAQALARMGQIHEALATSDASFSQEGQSAFRWLVRGEVLVASGQDVDQHCFTKAAQMNPDWTFALEIGCVYGVYHKHSRAITWFRQAVERAPDQAYCWFSQAQCEEALGLLPAARKSYEKCLELTPGYADARQALIALEAGQWSLTRRIGRFFRRHT